MKKMINKVSLYGKLYEMDLKKAVTGPNSKNPGTEYISGTIGVATDNECLNIVPVHYSYVTATTKGGKPNATFTTLNNIIEGMYGTVLSVGQENAPIVRIDSSIGLNEFYTDRNGEEELVSTKRTEGGFIHVAGKNDIAPEVTNQFDCDFMITNIRHVDENPDRGIPEKVILKGAVFNDFNKTLMPMEFSAVDPKAIGYYETLTVNGNEPLFTRIRGYQVNETIVRKIEEEGAWGTSVRTVSSSRRDWIVSWMATIPYEWDSDETLTVNEVNEAIKAREIMLATLKSRNAEYRASRGNTVATAAPAPTKEKFDF